MSWPLVSLESLLEIKKGKKHEPCEIPSKLTRRFLQIDDLRNDSKIKYTLDKKGVFADKTDVIIAWDGANAGTIGFGKEGLIGSTLAKLSFDLEQVNTEYLGRFLQSKFRELRENCTGATIPHISKPFLVSLKIPLPPLETQKQIAAVLEKADQLRKDCKLMEQELNSLAQSVFIDMFGEGLSTANKYTLGDVASVVSGVTKGQKLGDKVTVHAPYMRVANVQAGYLSLNEIKNIEVKLSDVEKYKLEKGDVLLTEGGDHDKLGRGAIWNNEVPGCIHQNHVFRVRLDRSKYTPEWLNGYLKTSFAKRYFLKCAKKTTNLASITITQLKGLPMPDVTIKKQLEFESINNVVKVKLDVNYALLAEYEKNFNALMQKAFKGELNLKTKAA